MDDPLKLIIVLEPAYDTEAAEAVRLLQSGCERLACELEDYMASSIEVVQGFLRDIPPDGFVLWVNPVDVLAAWHRCPEPHRRRLEKRLVLVDIRDDDIDVMAGASQIPAFVRQRSCDYWRGRLYWKASMVGLAAAAAHLPDGYEVKPFERAAYSQISVPHARQLPAMIADYLVAYTRAGLAVTDPA
jgi:hypothetical protein